MFIKKITLDGFKSYGRPVELTGFDPSFNAITGFNGSGKSNILDAICFVLGLNKLEVARCHSLNDLIYKNGQAGVTSASVTIEIDNSDGKFQNDYRNSSTILVRREVNLKNQSKFLIDGFCVTKEKLLDFFQSVSLNIQNPHFLIMQGKIVKVASMKPIEILSMVEETVGVSVYENKKKQNLTKIEKHDISLREINNLINENITPKLNQLREEEKKLAEYRNAAAEFDRYSKIYIAYCYMRDKDTVNNADRLIQCKNDLINEKMNSNEKVFEELRCISKEMENLQAKLNEEIGGNLKELENDLNEKRSQMDRFNTNKKLKMDALKEEQGKLGKLEKNLDKDQRSLEQKKKDYTNAENNFEKLKNENSENEKILAQAEKDFQGVMLGLSKGLDGEEAATLAQQVMIARDNLSTTEANLNRSKLKLDHTKKELSQKERKIKSDKDSYEKGNREIDIKTKEMEILKDELDNIDFTEERFNEVRTSFTEAKRSRESLIGRRSDLQSEVPNAKFHYSKPYASFDESDVIGMVCDLFSLKDPNHALAIEKVCGGKLYNVIVSNEEVAKALLSRGNLRERRTFLPLTKIHGRQVETETLRVAERLVGKGNVHYAINLVSFDSSLRQAMQYVFGDTLVCPNIDMAKKVAFAHGVRKRTITFDGEIFDPSGVLTGGALKNGPSTLNIIAELKQIREELSKLDVKIQQIDEEYRRLNGLAKHYSDKKARFDLKTREITLLQQSLTESDHYVLMKEIEEMKNVVKEEEENISKFVSEKQTIEKHIENLQNKIENAEAIRDKEKKEAEAHLKSARKKLENSSKKMQKEEQSFEVLSREIKHHEEALATLRNQVEKLQSEIDSMTQEVQLLEGEIASASKEIELAESKYNKYKKVLNTKSDEIRKLQKKHDELKSTINENEDEMKMLKHAIENVKISIKEASNNLKHLLVKNPWIKDEERYFDSPDSEYRVLQQNFNSEEFTNKLASLKSKKTALAKTVNMKANIMQGEKQKEFDELLKKRDIILQDRKKLIRYIENVEKEKDIELRKAWEKVNESFGHIFSTLLPNSCCKLVPLNSKTIKDGLEIKVCFGTVWKESLSELSGGQRSLVALSLVLALLKYNPAPLYILDEVDAALDQSHTQNIGLMIKRHFQNSQFIIVSLKDDMFSNANVLFQTKFIDGYSTVERR